MFPYSYIRFWNLFFSFVTWLPLRHGKDLSCRQICEMVRSTNGTSWLILRSVWKEVPCYKLGLSVQSVLPDYLDNSEGPNWFDFGERAYFCLWARMLIINRPRHQNNNIYAMQLIILNTYYILSKKIWLKYDIGYEIFVTHCLLNTKKIEKFFITLCSS